MPQETARPKVLVVDDDVTLSYLISAVCRELGYDARMAGSVLEAQAAIDEETFALLCCDANLADGSGLLVLDSLPDPPPAVILCTGAREPPQDPRIDRVLQKPFHVADLRATLDEWLHQPGSSRRHY